MYNYIYVIETEYHSWLQSLQDGNFCLSVFYTGNFFVFLTTIMKQYYLMLQMYTLGCREVI